MRIELRDGEKFNGSPMKIVTQMKGSTMFSDVKTIREYVDMVLRNAKMVENVELTVKGNTDEELARSLVGELLERGLAREV
jgi:ribosomal protein L7/L12